MDKHRQLVTENKQWCVLRCLNEHKGWFTVCTTNGRSLNLNSYSQNNDHNKMPHTFRKNPSWRHCLHLKCMLTDKQCNTQLLLHCCSFHTGHTSVNLILFISLLSSERKLAGQINIDERLAIVNKHYDGNQVFIYLYFKIQATGITGWRRSSNPTLFTFDCTQTGP